MTRMSARCRRGQSANRGHQKKRRRGNRDAFSWTAGSVKRRSRPARARLPARATTCTRKTAASSPAPNHVKSRCRPARHPAPALPASYGTRNMRRMPPERSGALKEKAATVPPSLLIASAYASDAYKINNMAFACGSCRIDTWPTDESVSFRHIAVAGSS